MILLRGAAVLAMAAGYVCAFAQVSEPPQEKQVQERPQAPESTAELIGVAGEISQLTSLSANPASADRWQMLWLHQRIYEQVMAASLQVDATIAQIDNEIARANEVRGFLADRRDRTVSRDNLLSAIFGGAIGATSDGLELSSKLDRTGTAVGVGAGAVGAGLALAGIHAQPGKTSHFLFPANMLAEFFDRPTLPNSRYPVTVWTFLNEIPSFGPPGVTRKEELMQSWVQVRRINSFEDTRKIDHVTSEPSEDLKLSIDDLEDRAAMLQDVRARISYLKRDLGELLASLPTPAVGP
jgi:uncharacterized small protein (DUF1192 family)